MTPRAVWIATCSVLLALLLALTPARSAVAADANVWVNTSSGVYHCPGGQYYGATKRGKFMSESGAVSSGYRAAYGRPCNPAEARAVRQSVVDSFAPASQGNSVEVWINTSSYVYHCPGSRYYGSTRKGSLRFLF
ncbi:MAG: hypothetical protein EOP93_12220 [Lysobacteraceae bacterium]|nr:MAG: hypothetical protein EOP93_12220 [Xanthomonadaceae bacterium]